MLKEKTQSSFDRAMVFLFGNKLNWRTLGNIAQNNYELGLRHFQLGNLKDAMFRLKIALRFDPNNAKAWYILGRLYLAEGNNAEAKTALKKSLTLKPNEESAYMLALVGGKKTPEADLPKTIPMSLALEYFDDVAPSFTKDQLDTYGYRGHTLLCNAIRAFLVPGRLDHDILELGVGTGLCGPLMRDVSVRITGVDISENMLAEAIKLENAQGDKIYDALVKRDLKEFLRDAASDNYDVVMAAGVLSYLGDVGEVFAQSSRVLKKGGLFAFTADIFDGQGVHFDTEQARFGFAKAYLQELAAKSGLTEMKFEEVTAYPGQRAWLCVYKK
jgi:predicted TPR repeat methyltransferase